MVSVTLSRGSTSIDLPLEEEAGEQLLAATFGKPELQVRDSGGTLNPRVQDRFSGMETYSLVGKLYDYATSHALADLIKSASGDPLTLEIPLDEYPDSVQVAPAAGQDSALSLSYPSGKRQTVDVELSLTRVDRTNASTSQQATTPTASGTGPVQLRVNGTSVDLPTADLSLERTIGRPNDVIRRQGGGASDPFHIAKAKPTSDVFTLSFETIEDIPSTLNTLTDEIFRTRLGRKGLVLDFQGVLGLGAVDVIPVGSGPFRQVHQAGKGWVINPTLELRRILTN